MAWRTLRSLKIGWGVVKELSAFASSTGASVASASASAAGAVVPAAGASGAVVLPAGAVHALRTIATTTTSANILNILIRIQNSFSLMTIDRTWMFVGHGA